MILVAGLAIAGIVGIAAAFYFSIRSGSGDKRLRSGGAGRARIDRRRGSRSAGPARSDRAAHTGRLAANSRRPAKTGRTASASTGNYRADESTGPNPVLDVDDPMLASADPGEFGHAADGADRTARPRRRVGFRKGSDVDEELWPAESFGGVSDEQFWDDLASDKPLTTTARTAQQDPGSRTAARRAQQNPASRMTARNTQQDPGPRNRPFDAPTAAIPAAAMPTAATPSAATPTAVPPVAGLPAATQPVQSMTSQVASATQPVRAATGPGPLMSVGQPTGAAAQAAETRGRRRANRSDDEDPLTSAAFSLRSSGPVDGRSSHRSRGATREQYDTGSAQETQAFGKAETGSASVGYPGGVPSFRPSESLTGARSPSSHPGNAYGDPSSVTQAMNTPPYGQNYGYSGGNSPAQAQAAQAQAARPDDLRRPNGPRSPGRHSAVSETTRSARQAYPQDGYQGSGGYPAASYPADGYPATGSHQASAYSTGGYRTGGAAEASQPGDVHRSSGHRSDGYLGNGQRAPYDPRHDYRRLTHPG